METPFFFFYKFIYGFSFFFFVFFSRRDDRYAFSFFYLLALEIFDFSPFLRRDEGPEKRSDPKRGPGP